MSAPISSQRIIFSGGSVLSPDASKIDKVDLVIQGNDIVAIGNSLDGDEVVNCDGLVMLPGLIDTHVHLCVSKPDLWRRQQEPFSLQFFQAIQNMALTLATGITFVRDAAGADAGLKRAVAEGLVPGPKMQISITMICQTGGHGDGWMPCAGHLPAPFGREHPGRPRGVVDGPDEMRKKVREIIRAGADVIKVATSGGVLSPGDDPRHAHFRDNELDVLVSEALAANRSVMAHAQASGGIKAALRAGVRSIEHGIYLDDEGIDLMLKKKSFLVPTLAAPIAALEYGLKTGTMMPEILDKVKGVIEDHRSAIRRASEAGVKIAFGTDAGVSPHGDNLREFILMKEIGMSSVDILRSATIVAADLMGISKRHGSLEVGKAADLVLVEGDPYSFDNLKERIRQVWMSGKLVIKPKIQEVK